jgi:TolA-binding protein
MNPKLKLGAYAVLLILSVWFAVAFYSNYSVVTKAAADTDATSPAAPPDTGTNAASNQPGPTNTVTNAAATPDTNAASVTDSNAVSTPDTNAAATGTNEAASTPGTNIAATQETNASRTKTNAPAHHNKAAKTAAPPPDVGAARGAMIGYLAAFIGSMIGLGLLIANDVTQFVGGQAVEFLFNDAGEGPRDPEYERAEAEWANGKFLDAIQILRDFIQKNPREIHASLRIAEIYEKDLKNDLAATLEYEEVLKHKLPAERWGWAAIHLCNLYSKHHQTDKALALLRRVADEYPKTGAAKKARVRLGIAEPEPDVVEEEVSVETEAESMEKAPAAFMEAHPPELEPRLPIPPPPPEPPKPGLPPGFRPKK